MRAAAIVLVLLLTVPFAVQAAPFATLVRRDFYEPGWFAQSFTLVNSSAIVVEIADDSSSEIVGHMVALYDDGGRLVAGTTFFSLGGQIVEAALTQGEVAVSNEGAPGIVTTGVFGRTVGWACDATCNPSRKFTLVATAGGELDWWGFRIATQGANKTTSLAGTEAFAYTTRQFDGTVAHVNTPSRGVHLAQDATHAFQADDRFLASFVKPPSDHAVARFGMEHDGDETRCPCFGEFPAGDHVFHYEDLDTRGIEAYLTYADVRLPPSP